MKVHSRYLDSNEIFCTSIKKIKNEFKDYNATFSFAAFAKQYRADSIRYTIGNKLNGTIICNASMKQWSPFAEDDDIKHLWVDFYAIKKDQFTDALREEFENVYIPYIKQWYLKYRSDKAFGFYELYVTLHEGKLSKAEYFGA